MKILREVSIKKVNNGYILEGFSIPEETRVYKDFAELINWITILFDER